MPDIVLHPETAAAISRLIASPPQSLMIIGPAGSGRSALARHLAIRLLDTQSPGDHPQYRVISAADGIEAIRNLQHFASLKVPGADAAVNRIAVVEQAEQLGIEAQNAFLKLLEEPPKGTLLMLLTTHGSALLPTIQSRVQSLTVRAPQNEALHRHFSDLGHDQKSIQQVTLMTGGLPGLATALLDGDATHPLYAAAEQARQLLRLSTFERLATVDSLAKQKETAIQTVIMLCRMAAAALRQMAQVPTPEAGKRVATWQRILTASDQAATQLRQNGQPKLVLTELMLAL
ncbi:MAG: dnaX [Candidatus Saccharibacteria bacterium]|nr:dnaX [Candidatus Saccharibacteria bacterium]